MAAKDYLKGHASTSKAPGTDKSWAHGEAGPFIGVVKNNICLLYTSDAADE